MKKIITVLLTALCFILLNSGTAFAEITKQIDAKVKTKRVPAGTVITLKLLDPVGSSNTAAGDQFDLMVAGNVRVDGDIVIPKGTVVRGSIEEVNAPKMLYKGGLVRLYFDHIVSATGKQVSFYAGICNNKYVTYDGALSSNTKYSDAFGKTVETTKNIVTKPTSWAWDKGGEILNGAPKYVLAPLSAIVSTPVAGVYFIGDTIADIFKKGKDINLEQGETIQVQILKPVDMPVY